MKAEDYLELIGDWKDPNPPPVLKEHNGVHVVRDDLLEVGSKARAADYLIGHCEETEHIEEWVYGSSPASGYAQISIPFICNKYGKKAVIFMAARSPDKLHDYQKRGIALGGDYRWVPNGMLNVTEKRAKDYVAENPKKRRLLPIGLDHPTAMASLIKVARALPIKPDEVWSVGSSGTLSRSLQLAWADAEVHLVSSGGHKLSERQIGRAIFHPSPYRFDQHVRKEEMPPFPSVPNYDAKAWAAMRNYHRTKGMKNVVLFWNVGA